MLEGLCPDAIYISGAFLQQVSDQSCDCAQILLKDGERYLSLSCRDVGDLEYIEIETLENVNLKELSYAVELGDRRFCFDGVQRLENGWIEGIRFRSEERFLFVFACDGCLALTQTLADIFNEHLAPPREEDEPRLLIRRV